MSPTVQTWIVALSIVLAAAWALRLLAPRTMARLGARLRYGARRAPTRWLADWLAPRSADPTAGPSACGACAGCGACPQAAKPINGGERPITFARTDPPKPTSQELG